MLPETLVDMDNFPLKPRDFQIEGIVRMRTAKRFLNRDKMGLGKTLQGAYASVGNTLVVCPNYLTEQWYEWLAGVAKGPNKHAPYAPYDRQNIVWCKGTFTEKLEALKSDADFHIINMEAFATHYIEIELLAQLGKWKTLILDEAHHFRNKDATRSKTAKIVAESCEYVYLLTGSPIYREVDDLYMQFHIIQPDIFVSYYDFVDNFCIADEGRYGTNVLGVKKAMIPELDRILSVLSIGRNYETAGRELPPIIEKYVPVEFPKPIMDAYNEMVAGYRMQLLGEEIKFDNFSQIMRTMRLMTAFPGKNEAVKDIIEDVHDSEHKIIVYTWYRESCDRLAEVLGGKKNDVVAIHGGIKDPHERRRLARKHHIIVATIPALMEGIDLSDARTLIFAEEHYTPGAMEQAIGRVQRERQNANNTDPILLYFVHVKDTIDEIIHAKAKARGGTIKELLSEALGIF